MWIDPESLKVFRLHSDIRAAFSNTSFPASITDDDIAFVGLEPLVQSPQPTHDPITHFVREIAPVLTDKGHWEQRWETVALEAETAAANQAAKVESAAAAARAQRNAKLADSDWTQVADSPVDKAAWATYRQALRDISQQPGFPLTVAWPVAPTV